MRRGDMKVAFLAMPYNGDSEWETECNIRWAAEVAADFWNQGFAVICPHLNSAHFGGAAPEAAFYAGYLEMVYRSDVVIAGYGWERSAGAREEVNLAKRRGMEIIYLEGGEA
jgi:hypothetical protein